MELYILDESFKKQAVVDQHSSLIWTERWSSIGDFQLDIASTPYFRSLFIPGLYFGISLSRRVMQIETVEKKTNDNGEEVLEIKGRSLEKILEDRYAQDDLLSTTAEPKWVLTGQPADLARLMFHSVCVLGEIDPLDILPGVQETSTYPTDTLDEPLGNINTTFDPMSLYSAIKQLCDAYDMGLRLYLEPSTSQIHFNIYVGSDRTGTVRFSPELDNMTSTTKYESVSDHKTVAYVISPAGVQMVYSPYEVSVGGFGRRVLVVNATDITGEGMTSTQIANALIQRGYEELAAHRPYTIMDGEVSENNPYRYELDYFLGDLVEMQDEDGDVSVMRVTEQIFASDAEGDRSYPTLSHIFT